ncbi:MAG TPA: DNA topoisomerase I [Nitrososphaerales archaeon]|nr:DNA topoisomerase I [Nitrososphaerales archaeon]
MSPQGGYTLVVCEKPDAAKRVADALSDGSARSFLESGMTAFRFVRGGEEFVVCSALGHLYGVSDPFRERTVYPVFDVEWYSNDLVGEDRSDAGRRVAAIRRLSAGASKFVNACDFDAEGETIGFNVLRYASGGKEGNALRAKFSTLTSEELVRAFADAKPQAGQGLAIAGRMRHLIDFVWGINLSRVLSQSAQLPGRRYATVSMGRVQGPTLGFLVQREREIRCFVPAPFWKISAAFEKDGKRLVADYHISKVGTRTEAELVRGDCLGKEGLVGSVRKTTVQVGAPAPFSVGDLQREAFRVFGLSPARTLQIAERLYLGALISYPRTGSQKLPPSIGYKSILQRLGGMGEYSDATREILTGGLRPVQGAKDDPAHPAIYPTGERPRGHLAKPEADIFDLVVRRFLAAFGQSARREQIAIRVSVGKHDFGIEGGRITYPGWTRYYGRYFWSKDSEVPQVAEGDRLKVLEVMVEEKFEQRPPRYSQGTLLEKMESERIGTKATRADIIATLVGRGYVQGDAMEATDLGFSVLETMEKYSPGIVTTELTRGIEQELEKIEEGKEGGKEVVRQTIRSLAAQLVELSEHEEELGREIGATVVPGKQEAIALGRCPVCKTGELRVVRSKKTKKRFVGCSNYASGCRASAPLPQRGTVKATGKQCPHCSWPIIVVYGGRFPWKLCVNPGCPAKGVKKREV